MNFTYTTAIKCRVLKKTIMKSLITTVFFVLLITVVATAQHANIGIKGGLNAYTIKNDNNDNINPFLGFHFGLVGHIHMSDQFAVQPEVVYSMQGSTYNEDGNEVDLNLNYVNIPLLFQYMFDNGFRLQAGPQLGILANAKMRIGNLEINIEDAYEPIDLGISFGLSYVNPNSNFGYDLRYNHGLSDISTSNNSEIFNRGFQASVFYLFNHK